MVNKAPSEGIHTHKVTDTMGHHTSHKREEWHTF